MTELQRDELANRVTRMERRFDWLDEHGTRAVNVLAVQVAHLAKEFGELESSVNAAVTRLDEQRKIRWSSVLGFIAIVLPMYGLVITLMLSRGLGI